MPSNKRLPLTVDGLAVEEKQKQKGYRKCDDNRPDINVVAVCCGGEFRTNNFKGL